MPRPKKGKRLGGSPSHQRKILANLTASLIEYEEITTTHAKAKVLRPYAEKIITKARRGDLHARRTTTSSPSCSTTSLPGTQTAPAATFGSSSSDLVAAMVPRWRRWSWFSQPADDRRQTTDCGEAGLWVGFSTCYGVTMTGGSDGSVVSGGTNPLSRTSW